MKGRLCHHCKQWIEAGDDHDCWTTTESALTRELSEDLREAWERLREAAVSFGEQRIYASHKSIMFARRSCYFFVRPKRSWLEVCVFLGREVRAPQVRRVDRTSATRLVHFLRITHRDEVEAPITDWLEEAYELNGQAPVRASAQANVTPAAKPKPAAKSTAGATRKPAAKSTARARRSAARGRTRRA